MTMKLCFIVYVLNQDGLSCENYAEKSCTKTRKVACSLNDHVLDCGTADTTKQPSKSSVFFNDCEPSDAVVVPIKYAAEIAAAPVLFRTEWEFY